MPIRMAVDRSNKTTGTRNVNAKRNLATNVARVASHTSFAVCTFSASSETWMPRASEHASAMAMVRTPPITTSFEPEKECKPTINPSVVIMAEVRPKHSPVTIDSFTVDTSKGVPFISRLSFRDCVSTDGTEYPSRQRHGHRVTEGDEGAVYATTPEGCELYCLVSASLSSWMKRFRDVG